MFYSMKTLPQLHYSPIAGIGTILLAIAISCFLLVKPIGRVRLFTFETDALFDAFAQWFVALPKLILLIALVAIARLNGFQIGLLLGFFFWPAIGLTTRSSFNRIRETDYFRATRVLGLPFSRQLFLHAMPNTKQVVFSASVTVFVAVVLLEASLSFLGLQADADYVSWGSLLNQARENFAAWWVFVPPGAGLFSFIWAAKWISETGKSF